MSALSTTRQSAAVPQPPVAAYIHQTLDIGHDFTAQIALDLVMRFQLLAQGIYIFSTEVIAVFRPVYTRGIKDFESGRPTNTIDVCQCDIEPFVSRQINAN